MTKKNKITQCTRKTLNIEQEVDGKIEHVASIDRSTEGQ